MPAFKLLSSSCGEQCFSYLDHIIYLLYLSSTFSTFSSPFNCPKTLLCQSYRGLEWAWSSVKCIRNKFWAAFDSSSLTAVRVYFSPPQSFTPSFTHGSKLSIPHSFSSFVFLLITWPRSLEITSSSLSSEISVVCRPHQPLTHHNSLRNSAAFQFVVTQYIRAVRVVCWKCMVSYTSLSPHAFLVGPDKGFRGPDTMSYSQRNFSKLPIWSLGPECDFKKRVPMGPTTFQLGKVL